MFALATKNFVEEVDDGGLLIPVKCLNDNIALLTVVVVKRKRVFFWQKPKYVPTDFGFNDIQTGDTPIKPVVVEADFIKYSGTFGDNIQGNIGADFVHTNVSLEGKDSSKLQSSFGSLKKEEVDVQTLLRDCKDRALDMSHCLIQQTKGKHKRVLGIVKECIVTTQPCSVVEEVQQSGQCGGSLATCVPKATKVTLKENASLSKDSNVTMEIPTHTTIAYGLIELEIKQDGRFELCLMSDTKGGFEVDGHVEKYLTGVLGAPAHSSENRPLQQELEKLSVHFQVLSTLPATITSSLLQQIQNLLQDQVAISTLQDVLDHMYLEGKRPNLEDFTMTESHKQEIQVILDLLEQSGQVESTLESQSTSVLAALYLMTSALDELTSDCCGILGTYCSPPVLQSWELLVQCVSGSGELPVSSAGLSALTEDIYDKTEHLFASSGMSLQRDGDMLKAEINQQSGNFPLILSIAIRSLASLAHV
ncbi:gasdermin-E-like [Pholidichthys leucotaenia]